MSPAKARADEPMWTYYDLTLHVDRLVGGIPKHPEIIRRWQDAHMTGKPGEPDTPQTAADATLALLGPQALDPEEVVAGIWTGFVTDADGNLGWEARTVKAMLKESANIVRTLRAAMSQDSKGNWKSVPLRARLAEAVFPEPKVITILDGEGKPIKEPESTERPIHVMTQQGPRTALKRTDYVENVKVVCLLKVLNTNVISERTLRLILEHASSNGLGTDRSQGNGTFTYELVKREQA